MFKKISEAIGEKINDFKAPSTPKSTPVKVSSSSLPARISYATQPQTTYSEISVYRPTIPNSPEGLAGFVVEPPYLVALLNSIKSEKARAFLKVSCDLVDKLLKHQKGHIHLEDHEIDTCRNQISMNLQAIIDIEENKPSVSVFQAPSLPQAIPEKVSSHTPPEKKWCPAKPQAVRSENIIYEVTMPTTIGEFAIIANNPPLFEALVLSLKHPKCAEILRMAKSSLDELQSTLEGITPLQKYTLQASIKLKLELIQKTENDIKNNPSFE